MVECHWDESAGAMRVIHADGRQWLCPATIAYECLTSPGDVVPPDEYLLPAFRCICKHTGESDTFEHTWPFVHIQNCDPAPVSYHVGRRGPEMMLMPGEVISLWLVCETHNVINWGRTGCDIAIAMCCNRIQADAVFERMVGP